MPQAAALWLSVAVGLAAFPSIAQDLEPKDYSPTAEIPLRLVSVGDGPIGSRIVMEVGNRTSSPVTAFIACSLYGADKSAIGSDSTIVEMVPPQSEVAHQLDSFTGGVASASCRITDTRSSN
jgi:hypothetical protein